MTPAQDGAPEPWPFTSREVRLRARLTEAEALLRDIIAGYRYDTDMSLRVKAFLEGGEGER